MKTIEFFFDPISPYAWLAFARLPEALQGLSYAVEYRPVLFGALLKAHAHKGPAEIEPKRAWTYRHVAWLAQHHGVPLALPAQHPFNPLPLLRLALAAGPNRRVVELLFRHVWEGGHDATEPARLAALRAQLAPELAASGRDPDGEPVKAALREATEAAMDAGVFGVPTMRLAGRNFWGLDALPMLRAALEGQAWFDGPAWDEAAAPRAGVVRR
jgi:2-hydroxychromene-2-carboxylate isomerase